MISHNHRQPKSRQTQALGADLSGVARDLHRPDRRRCEARFAEFADAWRDRYPAMINTWEQSWGEFVPFLEFPIELRTVVYTTDEIVNPLAPVSWAASWRSSPRRRVRVAR
jgi:Transposase, Mutator family